MKLSSPLNCNGQRLVALPDPTSPLEGSNKQYTDNAIAAIGINYNGNKHYRGSVVPVNPAPGDTWDEETIANAWIRTWAWNGTYWLSTQEFWKDNSIVTLSASTTLYYDLPITANVYVTYFKIAVLLGATNTSLAYWSFQLNAALGVSTTSNIAGAVNTSTTPANSWYISNTPLTSHINIAATGAKAFRVDITKIGSPSNIAGAIEIGYRLARI